MVNGLLHWIRTLIGRQSTRISVVQTGFQGEGRLSYRGNGRKLVAHVMIFGRGTKPDLVFLPRSKEARCSPEQGVFGIEWLERATLTPASLESEEHSRIDREAIEELGNRGFAVEFGKPGES
jgi:hypothetical protein